MDAWLPHGYMTFRHHTLICPTDYWTFLLVSKESNTQYIQNYTHNIPPVSLQCAQSQSVGPFLTIVQASNPLLILESFSITTHFQPVLSISAWAHATIVSYSSGVYLHSHNAPLVILHTAIWMIFKIKTIMLFFTTHSQHLIQVPLC